MSATHILITGANQGLGHTVAQQLLAREATLPNHPPSVHIYVGARSQEKADKACSDLKKYAAEGNTLEPVIIDLASDASIEALGNKIEKLDILINNGAILGDMQESTSPAAVRKNFANVYETNVFGTAALTYALIETIRKSKEPRVVNVSSGLGSIQNQLDPNWTFHGMTALVYPSSKTALNGVTAIMSKQYPDVKFVAVDPGYTSTAFNGHSGHQPVEVGAHAISHAVLDPKAKTASYVEKEGVVLPW